PRGDVVLLDFPGRRFDAVVCLCVLMHTPDWRGSLHELCRVAADRVVFDYPARWSAAALQAAVRRAAHLVDRRIEAYRVFSSTELARALETEGFRVAGEHRQ